MAVPYESTGRTGQKARTREALVAATRELLALGADPGVEDAASRAEVSRTTAYRYFPNQRALLIAAHPEIQLRSLLPDDAPTDVATRLELVMAACTRIVVEWEPELRTALRLSLEPGAGEASPVLRRGRAIGWIADALAPLRDARPDIDVPRLAVAIRSATGIEAFVWLTDVAGCSRIDAVEIMTGSARAILHAALARLSTTGR